MKVAEIFETMEYGPAPEAASPAIAWLDQRERTFGHFVDGALVPGRDHFDSHNPATGQKLARIAQASPEEVDHAVQAARRALPAWSALSGHERARYLYAIARQVQKHSRLLAVLETLDNGKPIRETRDIDIPLVARHFYHHAGWAQLRDREFPGCTPVGVALRSWSSVSFRSLRRSMPNLSGPTWAARPPSALSSMMAPIAA